MRARRQPRRRGPASRHVVGRGPVRDRLDLLLPRAVPGLRRPGRVVGRRRRLLRRLDLLHQRRPAAAARLQALHRRLVGEPDPVRRDHLLQRRHVPRDAGQLRHRRRQPGGLAPGGDRIDLLPGVRASSPSARSATSAGRATTGSRSSTSPAAFCSGSPRSAATCCRRPATRSTCSPRTPAPRSARCAF